MKFSLIWIAPCKCKLNICSDITDLCDAPDSENERKKIMCTIIIQPINTRSHLYMPVSHSDSGSLCLCFFITHAVLQTACCFPSRSGNVSYHSDYIGALLRDWDIRGRRAELAPWVHTDLCTVLCQVLHHWSYRVGGGCAWGSPSRCHHLSSLLSEGKVN